MENQVFYFLYHNGRQIMVSQQDWERSWLDWWHRVNKIKEIN
jgi:hypothetical protein